MATKPLTPYQTMVGKRSCRRLNIYEGAIRSSKTVVSTLRWIKFVNSLRENDDYPLLMIGKTERTLKRNVIDPMTKMLGQSRCQLMSGSGELRLLGRQVYVAGANDERSMGKIAGLTLQGAYGDELSLYPEAVWKMLTSRLSLEDSRFFGTTNPDTPLHFLKTGYLDRSTEWINSDGDLEIPHVEKKESDLEEEEEDLDIFRATFRLQDNPHLPESYLRNLKREYKGLWKKRYIDGLWVIADGAIYEMFDENLHTGERKRGNGPVFIGIDYGTTNPFGALAIEVTPRGLYVFSEYYEARNLTDAELSRNLRNWMKKENIDPRWICIDPSAASFVQQLYRDKVPNLTQADNSVLDGLRVTASLFSLEQLVIDPSCVMLLMEIPGYCWDADASKKGEDKPLKKADHLCDALRYAIATTEAMWRALIHDSYAAA